MIKNIRESLKTLALALMGAVFTLFLFFAPEICHDGYTYNVADGYNAHKKCVVVATSSNEVFVETKEGNIFSFYGDGYSVDDKCWIVLHNDEEVVEAQKI